MKKIDENIKNGMLIKDFLKWLIIQDIIEKWDKVSDKEYRIIFNIN